MIFLFDAWCIAVTLTKSDWSGEHVKVQNRLKKFSLQAGHEEMMDSARLRLLLKASSCLQCQLYRRQSVVLLLTCLSSQQIDPSFHFSPHMPTSFSRTSSPGSLAKPLSGHGSSPPKNDFFPHCPLIAHLPFSCFWVHPSSSATPRLIKSATHSNNRCRIGAVCH